MISGPYDIWVAQSSNGGWYVYELAGIHYAEFGPYRWRWLARWMKFWIDMR